MSPTSGYGTAMLAQGSNAFNLPNLFMRGATAEGLLPQAQGLLGAAGRSDRSEMGMLPEEEALARMNEGMVGAGWDKNPLGRAAMKFNERLLGAERGLKGWLQDTAKDLGKLRQTFRDAMPVDDEAAVSFVGQVAQGLGQAAGTLPIWTIPYFGQVAGTAGAVGQLYQEGFDDAVRTLEEKREYGLNNLTDAEIEGWAHDAGMKNMPAGALEALGDRLVVGRLLKPLKGKITVGGLLRGIAVKGAAEGATEAAQTGWQNYVAQTLSHYDPNRALDDEVIDSFLVGATVGLIASGAVDTATRAEGNRRAQLEAEVALQAAARKQALIAAEAARIGSAEMRAAEEGQLQTPDDIADAVASIGDRTRLATDEFNQTKLELDEANEMLRLAFEESQMQQAELAQQYDDAQVDDALQTIGELGSIDEDGVMIGVASDALAPYEAVQRKYPDLAAIVATDPRANGQLLVEIELEDGTRQPALFAGYWDMGATAFPAIGFPTESGFSHGMLPQGASIVTPVPTLEQWREGMNQVIAEELENAVSVEEAVEVSGLAEAGGVRPLAEEVRSEGVVAPGTEVAQARGVSQEVLTAEIGEYADLVTERVDRTKKLEPERKKRFREFAARHIDPNTTFMTAPDESTVTVQRITDPDTGEEAGFVQVDLNDATQLPEEQNVVSLNPTSALAAGVMLPIIPADLPTGRYTVAELRDMVNARMQQGDWVEAINVDDDGRIQRFPEQQQAQAQEGRRKSKKPKKEKPDPAGSRRRALARIGLPADGEPDILNAIQQEGGVPARSRQSGGEYDGFRNAFSGLAQWLVNTDAVGSKYGAGRIDKWLEGFYANHPQYAPAGVLIPNPSSTTGFDAQVDQSAIDDFYERVSRSMTRRKAVREQVGIQQKLLKVEQSLLGNDKNRPTRTAPEAITTEELGVGDRFKVDGENYIVTDIDEDGRVIIEDGLTYEITPGTEVYPDRGTLRQVKRDVEFLPEGEIVEPVETTATEGGQEVSPEAEARLVEANGARWFAGASGRPVVLMEVNGVVLPFYRSMHGTSGKQRGRWYAFAGMGRNGWFIKGSEQATDAAYWVPEIAEAVDFLNEQFAWPRELDDDLVGNWQQSPLSRLGPPGTPQDINQAVWGSPELRDEYAPTMNALGGEEAITQLLSPRPAAPAPALEQAIDPALEQAPAAPAELELAPDAAPAPQTPLTQMSREDLIAAYADPDFGGRTSLELQDEWRNRGFLLPTPLFEARRENAARQMREAIGPLEGVRAIRMNVRRSPGTQVLVTPDPQRPGRWRATRVDERGPVGHTEHSSLDNLISSYTGYRDRDDGGPSRGTPFELEVVDVRRARAAPTETLQLAPATELELAQEQDALAAQQEAAGNRERMLDLAEQPLTGDNSDVGQGVLFAGEEDLFSGPSAETMQAEPEPVLVGPPPEATVRAVEEATGTPAPVSTPWEQKIPATTVPNYTPELTPASLEAAEAEGLEVAEQGTPEGDISESFRGIITRVFGRKMRVRDRRTYGPEERLRARARANDLFTKAGLPMIWDAQNEVYRLASPRFPAEAEGQRLLELLREEIARGVGPDDPMLSVIINTIRNGDGGLWKNEDAFSKATRMELFSIAQAEASFYGLMLGALAKGKRTLSFVAENVDVVLHKVYSEAVGGGGVQSVVDRMRRRAVNETTDDVVDRMDRDPEGNDALDTLDPEGSQQDDLDAVIDEVVDNEPVIPGEELAAPNASRAPGSRDQSGIDLEAMFPLAEWRRMITERGAGDLFERALSRLRRKLAETDGEAEAEGSGDVEGNVKRMDRLLQRELRQIIAELVPLATQERARPDLVAELAITRGDRQTGIERLALLNDLFETRIEEMINQEIDENPDKSEDAIVAKYDMLRSMWDDISGPVGARVGSGKLLRKIANEEIETLFDSNNSTWTTYFRQRLPLSGLRADVQRQVRERLAGINAMAPEAALPAAEIARISDAIGTAFDEIAAKKSALYDARQTAAAKRAAERAAKTPEMTARRALDRLARVHADVQAWSVRRVNEVTAAIQRQAKNPRPLTDFVQELDGLGVDGATATSLGKIMERDREAKKQIREWQARQRLASAKPVSLAKAQRHAGMRPLVERIISASPEQQAQPGWRERTAIDYFVQNGMSEADARMTARIFDREFEGLFAQARKRAFDAEKSRLTKRERRELGGIGRPKQLWDRIERAVNAGIFDSSQVIEELARDYGWSIPTQSQKDRLKELALREQALRVLTERERADLNEDAAAIQAAEMEKTAATRQRRLALRREMQAIWASMSRPVVRPFVSRAWWKNQQLRMNTSVAISEFLSANMLFKLGFGVKQVGDVFFQTMYHIPTRALSASTQRYLNKEPNERNALEFAADMSATLADAYGNIVNSARIAIDQFGQGVMGRTEERNVEGLVGAVSAFDRMRRYADQRDLAGEPVQAAFWRILGIAEFSFRWARGLDAIQGTFIERQEIRERVITELTENGLDLVQARAKADEILGEQMAEMALAATRAKEVLDTEGITYSPMELRAAAYEVFKARQYGRMEAAQLPANDIFEDARILRQVNGWNMPETTGPGAVLGAGVRATGRALESMGLPLPVGRFANAIAIGTNRAFTYTPLGFFPSLFGGEQNFWFRTEKDRVQRRLEAAAGTTGAIALVGMAAAGLIRVWNKPPDDPEERELWEKAGHKAGTVELQLPGGRFIPLPLSTGPVALQRAALGGIGEWQDAVARRERTRARFAERALRTGEVIGEVPPLGMDDALAAVAWGGFQSVLGGRTAGGLVRSFTGEDARLPSVKQFIAAQTGPLVLGQPAYAEAMRALGTRTDPRFASILDFLVPTPGDPSSRRNFLNDPITKSLRQNIVQTLTGGSYGIVDPNEINETAPYRILGRVPYRPGALSRLQGYLIDGVVRPLNDTEFVNVTRLRGSLFKNNLMAMDENVDDELLDLLVRDAAKDARDRALELGAGAQALTYQQINAIDAEIDALPDLAKTLHRRLSRLPAEQWATEIQNQINAGTVPMENGQPSPSFSAEFNRLVQQSSAR